MQRRWLLNMRGTLITWAAAWPTITALLLLLDGLLLHWPLAVRTFVLTGLMVPLMTLLIVPGLGWILDRVGKG